jgi:hypothetical protein
LFADDGAAWDRRRHVRDLGHAVVSGPRPLSNHCPQRGHFTK